MLKIANISMTARQLSKAMDNDEILFDNAVQRGLVWDINRKSLLIDSMLQGYPINLMYFTKNMEKYDVLDGKQRCNCIHDYLNDKFILEGLNEITLDNGEEIDINGKKFSDLPVDVQDIISNYSIDIKYYDNITDDQVSELFFRINNYKALTNIEISRAKCRSLDTIRKVGAHPLFTTSLTAKAFEKYTQEDLVIKSWIMLHEAVPSMENKVVRVAMEKAVFTDDDINTLNKIYDRILDAYKIISADTSKATGKLSKKVAKRVITRTHMLSIIPITKKSLDNGISIELYTAWLKNFYCGTKSATKYDQYNSKSTAGSGKPEAIKSRLNVVRKDYDLYIKNHKDDKFEKVELNPNTETKEEVMNESTEANVNENSNETLTTDTVENNTAESNVNSTDETSPEDSEQVLDGSNAHGEEVLDNDTEIAVKPNGDVPEHINNDSDSEMVDSDDLGIKDIMPKPEDDPITENPDKIDEDQDELDMNLILGLPNEDLTE